jgi:hypothetical protein
LLGQFHHFLPKLDFFFLISDHFPEPPWPRSAFFAVLQPFDSVALYICILMWWIV